MQALKNWIKKQKNSQRDLRNVVYGVTNTTNLPWYEKLNDFLIDHTQITTKEKATFFSSLQVMIRSGISFNRAIKLIAHRTQNIRLARILNTIAHDIGVSGKSFSTSMQKHATVFKNDETRVIEAGELTGKIENVLQALSVQMEKNLDMERNLRSALMYPMVVLFFIAIGGIIVVTTVVPRFLDIFSEFGTELPWATQLLVWVYEVIKNFWWLLIGIFILVVWFFITWKNSPDGKMTWDELMLHLPLIAPVVNNVQTARIATNFGLMMESGIPVVKGLRLLAEIMPNAVMSDSIKSVEINVRNGGKISKSFEAEKVFDPVLSEVIEAGEESGSMAELLSRLGAQYQKEVDVQLANVSTILKPVILVVVAGAVVIMALAIFLPIFQLQENFSNLGA